MPLTGVRVEPVDDLSETDDRSLAEFARAVLAESTRKPSGAKIERRPSVPPPSVASGSIRTPRASVVPPGIGTPANPAARPSVVPTAPSSPARVAVTPDGPEEELTHMNPAALLGIAPEPARPVRISEPPAPKPTAGPPGVPLPLPAGAQRIGAPILENMAREIGAAQGAAPSRMPDRAPIMPASGIHRSQGFLSALAKAIPVVIGLVLVIGVSLAVAPLLMRRPEDPSNHVKLVTQGPGKEGPAGRDRRDRRVGSEAPAPQPKPDVEQPWLWIITEPPGARVEVGGTELGRTPYGAPSPVLDESVSIKLTHPGFQAWAGDVKRDETGHFRIMIKLEKDSEAN
jgi:hypothetical protein